LLEADTWSAPLVGVAELVTVLERVRVPTNVLPLSAADVPPDGGGVTDGFAEAAEAAAEVPEELKLVAELEVAEEFALEADVVCVEELVWVELV